MISLAVVALAAVLVWVALAWWLDQLGRRPPPPGPYDALVVAGCAVRPGGHPSPALERRVRLAVELYHQGVAPVVVLTGGVGRHPPAEAVVAAELCRALGVPSEGLRIEAASASTLENAAFSARLVTGRVLVVSDRYHVLRCRHMFGLHFSSAEAVGAAPRGSRRAYVKGALREAASVLRHGVPVFG